MQLFSNCFSDSVRAAFSAFGKCEIILSCLFAVHSRSVKIVFIADPADHVAVSRAKQKLIIIGSRRDLERLHDTDEPDDIYELAEYVRTKGKSTVTPQQVNSRALGIKPYSNRLCFESYVIKPIMQLLYTPV